MNTGRYGAKNTFGRARHNRDFGIRVACNTPISYQLRGDLLSKFSNPRHGGVLIVSCGHPSDQRIQ